MGWRGGLLVYQQVRGRRREGSSSRAKNISFSTTGIYGRLNLFYILVDKFAQGINLTDCIDGEDNSNAISDKIHSSSSRGRGESLRKTILAISFSMMIFHHQNENLCLCNCEHGPM